MTVQEVFALFRHILKEVANEILPEKGPDTKGMKQLAIAVVLVLGVGGAFYFYRNYVRSQNEKAFGFLVDYIEEYERKKGDEKIDWAEVEQSFDLERGQYDRTSAAPYFFVYKAEQLIRQGKKHEALENLDKAIDGVSSDSPFVPLYKTKRALLCLDIGDEVMRDQGLSTLRELALNENNIYRDCSAYYLGLYYWIADDIKQAKTVWQELVDTQKQALAKNQLDQRQAASPWAELAKAKLAQIA